MGTLENKGFEFVLNTQNLVGKFKWSTSFNIAFNKGRVVNILGQVIEGGISSMNRVMEGQPVGVFYTVEYAGVDPENGDALFYLNTKNTDGTLNRGTTNNYSLAQRTILGSPYPTLMAGLTNTITYKEFDLSFTFQGEWGASMYNEGGKFQSGNARYEDNQTIDQLDRWQKPGDITMVPQARMYRTNGQQASTRYLESSDFVRLRNLSLGYTFSKKINHHS